MNSNDCWYHGELGREEADNLLQNGLYRNQKFFHNFYNFHL